MPRCPVGDGGREIKISTLEHQARNTTKSACSKKRSGNFHQNCFSQRILMQEPEIRVSEKMLVKRSKLAAQTQEGGINKLTPFFLVRVFLAPSKHE